MWSFDDRRRCRRARLDRRGCPSSGRWRSWAPARWARRSPRTSRTPACRRCCSTSRPTCARRGSSARGRSSPIRSSRRTALALITHRRLRHRLRTRIADADWIIEAVVEQLDVKRDAARARRRACGGRARSSARTRRASRSARSPRAGRRISAGIGSARISSIRRATCGCWRSSRRPTRIPPSSSRLSPLRGSPARQGHGHREGHAELHRQPHRALRRHANARGARSGALHDRGDRRDHGPGARPAEERDVPHRATSPASTSSRTWRAPARPPARGRARRVPRAAAARRDALARMARREGRPGLLPAREERATASPRS